METTTLDTVVKAFEAEKSRLNLEIQSLKLQLQQEREKMQRIENIVNNKYYSYNNLNPSSGGLISSSYAQQLGNQIAQVASLGLRDANAKSLAKTE